MYKITPTQYNQDGVCYGQYLLEDTTAGTTLTITPEKGGSISSMTLHGEEFIWLRHPNFECTDRPRYGVPVLFPQCGLAPEGQNEFDGQKYPMSIHGFACLLPWQVVGQSTEGGASITLRLTENALTRVLYPFEFCIDITYTLKGNTVTLSQTYHNRGSQPMPFAFGFHPYFTAGDVRQLEFDVKAHTVTDPVANVTGPYTGSVDFPYNEDQTNRSFRGVTSPAVVTDKSTGHRITVSFDEHFDKLVLWSQCPLGFICVEPWNGWPGGLNTGKDCQTLQPGQSLSAECAFSIEKL